MATSLKKQKQFQTAHDYDKEKIKHLTPDEEIARISRPARISILNVLLHKPIRFRELATFLGIRDHNLTGHLHLLKEYGYVKHGEPTKPYVITDKGKSFLKDIKVIVDKLLRERKISCPSSSFGEHDYRNLKDVGSVCRHCMEYQKVREEILIKITRGIKP